MGKPLQTHWRESYRANRYLMGKPISHIAARLRYQMEAMLTLTPNGKIGVEVVDGIGRWMWERVCHTLHEIELRGQPLPDGFLSGASLPRVSHPAVPKEHVTYESRKRSEKGEMFKFGKKRWMSALLNHGSLRFTGASFYRDPSLNEAIRDDELSFAIFPAHREVTLSELGIRGVPAGQVPGGIVLSHPTDFYVQCFSTRYALRMFKDFEADACVVIYDAAEFGRRVVRELRLRFPEWIVGCFPVSYVDPDDPGPDPLPIPAAKHMRYAYQVETRIVCHPKVERLRQLHPFSIEVGSMADIAELVEL